MSTRLTFICHASTGATRKAAFPADEPLEPRGQAKATAAARLIGRFDTAWTSPALRALQTARALGLQAEIDSGLRDIDLGRWAGRSLDEVGAGDPEGLACWMSDPAAAPHGGEAIVDLLDRTAAWLDGAGAGDGRIAAVTHAALIRAALVIALDARPSSFWRIDVAPLCFVVLQGRPGRWTLQAPGFAPRNTPLQQSRATVSGNAPTPDWPDSWPEGPAE